MNTECTYIKVDGSQVSLSFTTFIRYIDISSRCIESLESPIRYGPLTDYDADDGDRSLDGQSNAAIAKVCTRVIISAQTPKRINLTRISLAIHSSIREMCSELDFIDELSSQDCRKSYERKLRNRIPFYLECPPSTMISTYIQIVTPTNC